MGAEGTAYAKALRKLHIWKHTETVKLEKNEQVRERLQKMGSEREQRPGYVPLRLL